MNSNIYLAKPDSVCTPQISTFKKPQCHTERKRL